MAGKYDEVTFGARTMTPKAFLQQQDLHALEQEYMEAMKDPAFKSYVCCLASVATVSSVGVALLLQPAMCYIGSMFQGARLALSPEGVEYELPTPSCCVLAQTKRTVRYEQITDVTVEDDCCLRMFSLKKVVLQTAGTGGISAGTDGAGNPLGVQAMFLRDPTGWKDAINHAVHLYKAQEKGDTMTRGAVPKLSRNMKIKLDNVRMVEELELLAPAELHSLRVSVLLGQEDFALKLAAAHQLVQEGAISAAEFAEAKAAVLSRCQQPA